MNVIMQRNHGIKKLREIKLSQNSNDIDMGAPNSEKLGNKSAEQLQIENERLAAELEAIKQRDTRTKRLEREEYLKRLQLGDPEAAQIHMKKMEGIRRYNEQMTMQSRYEFLEKQRQANIEQEKKEIEAKVAKSTPVQKQKRLDAEASLAEKHKNEIAKIENYHKESLESVDSFFTCTSEAFEDYYNDEEHTIESSPVGALIEQNSNGHFQCSIDRNELVYIWQPEIVPIHYFLDATRVQMVERHIKTHRPEIHKEYVLKALEKEHSKNLNEAKERQAKESRDLYLRI
jgi:hypothetical protein